eukprot:m.480741 g.480741  ORF g.480741 m.480741 type:complete len:753 (+) comp21711_c0_seq3:89-2347(+)
MADNHDSCVPQNGNQIASSLDRTLLADQHGGDDGTLSDEHDRSQKRATCQLLRCIVCCQPLGKDLDANNSGEYMCSTCVGSSSEEHTSPQRDEKCESNHDKAMRGGVLFDEADGILGTSLQTTCSAVDRISGESRCTDGSAGSKALSKGAIIINSNRGGDESECENMQALDDVDAQGVRASTSSSNGGHESNVCEKVKGTDVTDSSSSICSTDEGSNQDQYPRSLDGGLDISIGHGTQKASGGGDDNGMIPHDVPNATTNSSLKSILGVQECVGASITSSDEIPLDIVEEWQLPDAGTVYSDKSIYPCFASCNNPRVRRHLPKRKKSVLRSLRESLRFMLRCDQRDQACSPGARIEVEVFIKMFSSYEHFCRYEHAQWFSNLRVLAPIVTEVVSVAKSIYMLSTGLKLMYIIGRNFEAYAYLESKQIVSTIKDKIYEHIDNADICKQAMLALGNVTFQMNNSARTLLTIFEVISAVLEKHMDNASTVEPALWTLANTFFDDALQMRASETVALLADAIHRHDKDLALLSEASYCTFNILCDDDNHPLVIEARIGTMLASYMRHLTSERYVIPVMEVLSALCITPAGTRQVADALFDICTPLKPGALASYDFKQSSSLVLGTKDFSRVLRDIAIRVARYIENHGHPTLCLAVGNDCVCPPGAIIVYEDTCEIPKLQELAARVVANLATHTDQVRVRKIPLPHLAQVYLDGCNETCSVCHKLYATPYAVYMLPTRVVWVCSRACCTTHAHSACH